MTRRRAAQSQWAIAARERNCYCDLWDKDPDFLRKEGIPSGYCGKCERCGAPGHTRHYPGPVPCTGSWCDKCFRVLKWTAPFRSLTGWLFLLAVLGIVAALAKALWLA